MPLCGIANAVYQFAGVTLSLGMTLDDSPAAELWRRTLSQIPSIFGRLAYLSSLRDVNTGDYRHFGFSQRFSESEANRTLKRSHVNNFADWLCFSLEEQRDDLEIYLAGFGENRQAVLNTWRTLPPFANFIPAATREGQRKLFLSDLEFVLQSFFNL